MHCNNREKKEDETPNVCKKTVNWTVNMKAFRCTYKMYYFTWHSFRCYYFIQHFCWLLLLFNILQRNIFNNFLNRKRYIKTFLHSIFANYTINMIPWHLCLFHILDLNFTRLGIYRYHFEHGTFFSPVITTLNEASLMSWRSLQSQLIQESKFVFQWSIFEIILSVNNFLMRTVIDRIVEFIYTIIAKWFLLLNILCISLKANCN